MRERTNFADGELYRVGRIEFTADAIKAFAAAYDPQPQHLDECAAKATPLQGLAASGWQACAAVIRRVEQHFESASLRLGVASIEEIRWLRPVRPGDSLEIRVSWQQACTCSDCVNAELRAIVIEAVDQSHVPVLRVHGSATLACCAASPAELRGRCVQRPLRMSRVRRRPGGRLVRYFEDVELGDEIALEPYDFTPGALHTYAGIIDGVFGGSCRSKDTAGVLHAPSACGWHVVAAWMRRIVDYYHAEADWLATRGHPVPLLGPAAGARCLTWFKPVRTGDRITFSSWAEHKVKAGTSREWGLLVAGAEGRHQNGDLAVSLYPQFLLQKRPA